MIQHQIVAEHARQFDNKLPDRSAGSQNEFAAATYILAHLQEAGYTPLLDPVPVQDLIRSTNVIASPPRAPEMSTLVAISYDTASSSEPAGTSLGTWLDVARALYARAPEHSTGFVALGAEHATVGGGDLGSRRLAEYLIDGHLHPVVIVIGSVTDAGETFDATGSAADELLGVARSLGVEPGSQTPSPAAPAGVFAKAGFYQATVSGSIDGIGRVLLAALSQDASPSASPR